MTDLLLRIVDDQRLEVVDWIFWVIGGEDFGQEGVRNEPTYLFEYVVGMM